MGRGKTYKCRRRMNSNAVDNKQCGCRDGNGKRLGKQCLKLRRGGFTPQTAAEQDAALLPPSLPGGDCGHPVRCSRDHRSCPKTRTSGNPATSPDH
jgi:hypothetical protein